jgi:hypothetical protein
LHVVLFAAAADALGPAYDGIVMERVTPGLAHKAALTLPRTAVPKRH